MYRKYLGTISHKIFKKSPFKISFKHMNFGPIIDYSALQLKENLLLNISTMCYARGA